MRYYWRGIAIAILLIPGLWSAPGSSTAQDLLGGMEFTKQYLLQLSGTVMNEPFSGVQALLTLMPPAPGASNPYQLTIDGFPKKNSRNSLFWNSTHSEMTAIANEITCDIKRTFVKPVPMYFVFLSPELLRHTGAAFEGEAFAEKTALPTLINARAGRLRLNIHSTSVTGTVWMKGYDPVEKAFVHYNAKIYGKRSYKLEPKQELKK